MEVSLNIPEEFLAGLPTIEEVLRLRPSPQLQTQLEQLLEKQRTQGLDTY
ncbi:hypothetical protein QUF74_16585 [Candidatus Halobeggiatoa sp. HSG11]|nr:hypothetical protein [Candidatus Halobeggiatoa sp. HSG11]